MIGPDGKSLARVREQMKRALILESSQSSARLLADLLRARSGCESWTAPTNTRALELARAVEPQLIFIEHRGDGLDGPLFSRALRRGDLACRKAPIVMISSEATAAAILGARDSGVHEFLRKPYTIKDLVRRLEAVLLLQRGWIEAVAYVGPDRRRFNSGDYKGASKRRTDTANRTAPHREAIVQALKIVRAAMRASQSDPVQALRALVAQAQDLRKVAVASSDLALSDAAAELERYLRLAQLGAPLTPEGLDAATRKLWAYLPGEEQAAA
jgi:DNA-binding response OmpR family regulator